MSDETYTQSRATPTRPPDPPHQHDRRLVMFPRPRVQKHNYGNPEVFIGPWYCTSCDWQEEFKHERAG